VAGSDDPPTAQAREVHGEFKKQIATLASQLDNTLSQELGALNKLLRDRSIPNVVAR
jgi:hypothetical protein